MNFIQQSAKRMLFMLLTFIFLAFPVCSMAAETFTVQNNTGTSLDYQYDWEYVTLTHWNPIPDSASGAILYNKSTTIKYENYNDFWGFEGRGKLYILRTFPAGKKVILNKLDLPYPGDKYECYNGQGGNIVCRDISA